MIDLIAKLKELYPEAKCSLTYEKDYELLFAARLSAQCTDKRVNSLTPALFAKFKTLKDFADCDIEALEEAVKPCGFYRAKAGDIKKAAGMLISSFGGALPDDMEGLLKIPGVGRKTANLLLGELHGKPAIVADTHCIRLANRFGLCDTKNPDIVERELKKAIPSEEQLGFCHRLIAHGRAVCKAIKPMCAECKVWGFCKYVNLWE